MVERGIHFDEAVNEFEKKFIKRVLDRSHGNQSRAARLLGIHRNTLAARSASISLARVIPAGRKNRGAGFSLRGFVLAAAHPLVTSHTFPKQPSVIPSGARNPSRV